MKTHTCTVFILAAGIAAVASACQVPVFRYALERWAADQYELVVIHEGELNASQSEAMEDLKRFQSRSDQSANVHVKLVEAKSITDPVLTTVWNDRENPDEPLVVALYPKTAAEVPDRLIDVMPLRPETVKGVVDSPLRREIANRLVSGESAVWIFVPSGDETQDKVAMATLRREVGKNEETLELPEQDEIEDEEELLQQVDIELRLDFSIVTLDRDDPKERFFLKSLLASEPDLEELNQPMAFPVLGRGRVLYALVGKGIGEMTIGSASRFIIGPCSCQVKNQNPGFDLLMINDWEDRIGKAKLSDPMPETTDEPVLLTIPPGRNSKSIE